LIDPTRLKDLVSKSEYSRLEKILLCMAVDGAVAKQVKDIKNLAVSAGLRAAKNWNISSTLGASDGLAARTDQGWELTSDGRKRISEIAGPYASSSVPVVASKLRQHLPSISDPETKEFIEESIECYEANHLRAAVVLSWVGAVSMLHKHVIDNRLSDFNKEATRRDAKWRQAKTADDLGRMKEFDFLNISESLSIIGKNVKQELEVCLKLRNSCGHPNSLKIGEARVAAHMEILVLNVFAAFSA
jgi:hypothetical protein